MLTTGFQGPGPGLWEKYSYMYGMSINYVMLFLAILYPSPYAILIDNSAEGFPSPPSPGRARGLLHARK